MPKTILVTGFGPFPSAPFNPTEELVRRIARKRLLPARDVELVPHIFRTSYASVDLDLPLLLREHAPDAILMFGLAARTRHLRIETSARNAIARVADVDRHAPIMRVIDREQPSRLALRTPVVRLLASARAAHVPARPSRDAGRYLCNYLCWRATEATRSIDGPRIATFIHVPLVRRLPLPARRLEAGHLTMDDLVRSGLGFLRAVAAALRH